MVTAGVYMVARSNALFVLALNAMKTVAIIGALTAIFAATIALVQNDIKRVLAYFLMVEEWEVYKRSRGRPERVVNRGLRSAGVSDLALPSDIKGPASGANLSLEQ